MTAKGRPDDGTGATGDADAAAEDDDASAVLAASRFFRAKKRDTNRSNCEIGGKTHQRWSVHGT